MVGNISTAEVIGNLNVVEVCLVENYNNKQIIDLGAINHVLLLFKGIQTK